MPNVYNFRYLHPLQANPRDVSPRIITRNARMGHTPPGERYVIEDGIQFKVHDAKLAVPADHPDIDLILRALDANPFVVREGGPVTKKAPVDEIKRPMAYGLPETAPGARSEAPPLLSTSKGVLSAEQLLGD